MKWRKTESASIGVQPVTTIRPCGSIATPPGPVQFQVVVPPNVSRLIV